MEKKQRGRTVNRGEVADLFGVSLPTVTAWVRRGCPYLKHGGMTTPWEFNTSEVAAWLQEDAKRERSAPLSETEQELRCKKLAAEVGLIEIQLDRQVKAVAPAKQMEMAATLEDEIIRRHLLAVPNRVAAQLVGEKNEGRFKRILAAELVLALEKAASADIELAPDSA